MAHDRIARREPPVVSGKRVVGERTSFHFVPTAGPDDSAGHLAERDALSPLSAGWRRNAARTVVYNSLPRHKL
jgi:hypothetical protein